VRSVPDTSADINPNGLLLDKIPQNQIDFARQSSLLHDNVPEPISLAIAGSGLLVLVTIRRRRKV